MAKQAKDGEHMEEKRTSQPYCKQGYLKRNVERTVMYLMKSGAKFQKQNCPLSLLSCCNSRKLDAYLASKMCEWLFCESKKEYEVMKCHQAFIQKETS